MDEDWELEPEPEDLPPDPKQREAAETLAKFFDRHRARVFFSRQVEVLHEGEWFHWVTNRALEDLQVANLIRTEERQLRTGTKLILMWHRRYRYYRRDAARLVALVEEYSDPNIGGALGLHGESLVLEGFARNQFVMLGRNTNELGSTKWTATAHNLDFLFERNGLRYGVEVKNTLGYMSHAEMKLKIAVCQHLGIKPVFAARMLPKSWIHEIAVAGGFALVFKYQLYPWTHRELSRRVQEELGLPVDSPRALQDGTMERFLKWHRRQK